MLLSHYNTHGLLEAGCDEAGRGPLAGSVFAAAVVLPPDYRNPRLDDSKKLTARRRQELRQEVECDALAWAVAQCTPQEIDRHNILRASIMAMHRALEALSLRPEYIIVDGNRFTPWPSAAEAVPSTTIVKGDGKYLSIAAASVLAKTYRDDYMARLHQEYPMYDWIHNQGYPTLAHRQAILRYGPSPYHRRTFNLLGALAEQELPFS